MARRPVKIARESGWYHLYAKASGFEKECALERALCKQRFLAVPRRWPRP